MPAPETTSLFPPDDGDVAGEPKKRCSACRSIKPTSEFNRNARFDDGLAVRCRSCMNAAYRRRYATDPRFVAQVRAAKLRHRYGISVEQYEELLASQGGRCALCRTDSPAGRWRAFNVDHCHETGRVRGILCTKCNGALGVLGDTVEGLEAALAYVKGPGVELRTEEAGGAS